MLLITFSSSAISQLALARESIAYAVTDLNAILPCHVLLMQ
jgi:hypothetical protein